ncbi:MAG: IS5 family transposase, partial [Sedimentisphaerales bacterium]|nr:IS5 family transposase [Sedimentisphaerales bacterium]
PLGIPSTRNEVRFWHDLLASTEGMANGRSLGAYPLLITQALTRKRPFGLVPCRHRQCLSLGHFWGAKTGPNPTDRRKMGTKHHLLTDANGIPLAIALTGANRHDSTQLKRLVMSIPPVAGKRGKPRQHPDSLCGDRAYDSNDLRQFLRNLGIKPYLAHRRVKEHSGLGVYRWVVERSLSWLHQFRRLRVCYERRDDIHEAFCIIGCILLCWNAINFKFC